MKLAKISKRLRENREDNQGLSPGLFQYLEVGKEENLPRNTKKEQPMSFDQENVVS